MNSIEDTTITISQYAESDNDELLLLSGSERLEYFSEKPDLKEKSLKQQFLKLIKSVSS